MIGSLHLVQNLVHHAVDPCPKSMHKRKVNVIFSHSTSQRYLAKNRSVRPTSLFLVSNLFQVPTKADWAKIAGDFTRRWQFPNCLGAVDGKHVAITCPPKSGSAFFNYRVSQSGHLCTYTETNSINAGGVVCPCLLENVWWQHRQPMCTTHL